MLCKLGFPNVLGEDKEVYLENHSVALCPGLWKRCCQPYRGTINYNHIFCKRLLTLAAPSSIRIKLSATHRF
jgi:CRISPR/Cas system-associated protein Csx1